MAFLSNLGHTNITGLLANLHKRPQRRANMPSYAVATRTVQELFMAVLRSRCGHYIYGRPICNRADRYILPCGFFLSSSIFPHLISAVGDWMSTILPHMVWPYANLECRSARGSLEIQDAKKSPFWHHRTTLSGYIFGTKACIDSRKKTVKQQYLLHMS